VDSRTNTILEPFLRAADAASRQRSDVDADIARELMAEAATLLHNGLALDDLDAHDAAAVIDVLSNDLVARDPGAAVRARGAIVAIRPRGYARRWHARPRRSLHG
jgi:hypothetical protein